MEGMLYEYYDGAGRRYTFTDVNAAYKSYIAFLKKNGLRLQDLKIYAEKNMGFKPLAAYEASTGRFLGFIEMYY